jgi:hypothetical protein
MARAGKAESYYPKLIEAFRLDPGNIDKAAQAAGVHWKTAERAWKNGVPTAHMPPISVLIQQEQEKARAMIEAERLAKIAQRQKELEQAAENAIQARKQEGQITQLVRQQSLAALTAVSVFAKAARELAETVNGELAVDMQRSREWTEYEKRVLGGDPNAAPPAWANATLRNVPSIEKLLQYAQRMADYSRTITHMAREAMEMERLHLGEPIAVIRHDVELREMTMEEVDTRTANALRVIDRAKEAGGLKVLPGGKTTPVVGQRVVVR